MVGQIAFDLSHADQQFGPRDGPDQIGFDANSDRQVMARQFQLIVHMLALHFNERAAETGLMSKSNAGLKAGP